VAAGRWTQQRKIFIRARVRVMYHITLPRPSSANWLKVVPMFLGGDVLLTLIIGFKITNVNLRGKEIFDPTDGEG
jgi:hypothetical protein